MREKIMMSILWKCTIVFPKWVFIGYRSGLFINIQIRKQYITFKQERTEINNMWWIFSDPFFHTIFRRGYRFWYFSIVSKSNQVSEGRSKTLTSDVSLKKDWSQNELFNDWPSTDGCVSWIVCICRLLSLEPIYFSEVDGFLIIRWWLFFHDYL